MKHVTPLYGWERAKAYMYAISILPYITDLKNPSSDFEVVLRIRQIEKENDGKRSSEKHPLEI